MKKVRFESPVRCFSQAMENSECQSPRPFMERQEAVCPVLRYDYPRILPYSPDPVQRYECSNTPPYPLVSKTSVESSIEPESQWPSKDLELSMLDSSFHEPRHPVSYNKHQFIKDSLLSMPSHLSHVHGVPFNTPFQVLSSIENTNVTKTTPVENHAKDSNFFIKRDNLHKMYSENMNPLRTHLNRLSLSSDNNPVAKKAELVRIATQDTRVPETRQKNICQPVPDHPVSAVPLECRCHHCVKIIQNVQCSLHKNMTDINQNKTDNHCPCLPTNDNAYYCNHFKPATPPANTCSCNKLEPHNNHPKNAVDKKTWTIERYEQNKKHECMEVEKQNNVTKEKREPTVSDLFKIIKLQNEQLQLLQEKVDKFISASNNRTNDMPKQSSMIEQIALETVQNDQHKISIGVMTSFEMVTTSTVINKEIVTQTKDNAQIQCNRSQISIKEVVSKSQPINLNFLDGIMPKGTTTFGHSKDNVEHNFQNMNCDRMQHANNINEDKTLNELSLYNVHVDNATTPLISPEQSLYLDVRDYSDSDSSNDDHSNIGWTYYNKVMTHVNGVLQDSEMPSSASALERNTQQCVQMQIDKTNVSVTKRVKFGDDPLGIHQPHLYTSTDTSLKMNQLAAKYLKGGTFPTPSQAPPIPKPSVLPIDMSFATRNYMERHRLLHGPTQTTSRSPPTGEMPRFLDITALKRQPKLL